MELNKVVIVGAVRTPIGALGGGLAPVLAQPLATHAIKAALTQAGVDADGGRVHGAWAG
jgi:acetyl-CoA C-acetyltransferase